MIHSKDKKLVTLVNTNQIKPAIAPIAFDYLYEPLIGAGFEVELLDLCFAENFEMSIAAYCRQKQTDFWGITMRNTDDTYFAGRRSFIPLVRNMIQAIKRHSDAPIIMGGVGFSVMPEKLMDHLGIDFGIVCEGELSFPNLLRRLTNGEPYHDISGLVYRTPAGLIRNRVEFGDLAEVGTHSRHFINNKKYFAQGGQIGIETKRGCNRPCIYCVEPLAKGRKVRLRNPSDVVDEMDKLVQQGINVFHINDSEFNLNVTHCIGFCQEIMRRKLEDKIVWYAYGMPAPLPDELVKEMVASGCVGLNLGVDSASEKMLRILMRTFRPQHIAAAVETCNRHHLLCAMDLLFGAPGETSETVKESIEFVKKLDIERVIVTLGYRIFPGTTLEKLVRVEGISPDNPNLYGTVVGNDDLIEPIFYLSSKIASDPYKYVAELIDGDERFISTNSNDMNYDANQMLVDAIQQGERGAYWAILSRKMDKERAAQRPLTR
jgi:radical SAM superfamily enzyme YgiQ (UPF0313 family)